ncbi:hypothetical protein ACFY6U_50595 [Streptomyces sp. NPDC013157]|uniref:hypothetical protein n=1 Tax=Streptomyces sp. NPDC013157 TaxID=3364861 RepID=UPI00369048C4
MRHNGRTPIKASSLRPENLNLREGETSVVCPDCDSWRRLTRSMIHPHRDGVEQPKPEGRRYRDDTTSSKPSNGRRCPGSAQRIEMDITPEQWSEKLHEAETTASGRRTTNPVRKPRPQAAPTPSQMAPGQLIPAVGSLNEQLTEHLQSDCVRCRVGRCSTVIELRQRIRRITRQAAGPQPQLYGQLRAALTEHRATCSPCTQGSPCDAGRKLTARISGLAQDQMRRTRPALYRPVV